MTTRCSRLEDDVAEARAQLKACEDRVRAESQARADAVDAGLHKAEALCVIATMPPKTLPQAMCETITLNELRLITAVRRRVGRVPDQARGALPRPSRGEPVCGRAPPRLVLRSELLCYRPLCSGHGLALLLRRQAPRDTRNCISRWRQQQSYADVPAGHSSCPGERDRHLEHALRVRDASDSVAAAGPGRRSSSRLRRLRHFSVRVR